MASVFEDNWCHTQAHTYTHWTRIWPDASSSISHQTTLLNSLLLLNESILLSFFIYRGTQSTVKSSFPINFPLQNLLFFPPEKWGNKADKQFRQMLHQSIAAEVLLLIQISFLLALLRWMWRHLMIGICVHAINLSELCPLGGFLLRRALRSPNKAWRSRGGNMQQMHTVYSNVIFLFNVY